MPDASITVRLDVDKSQAFDELSECWSDIHEILALVPDYRRVEAAIIAKRIAGRMKGWVTSE